MSGIATSRHRYARNMQTDELTDEELAKLAADELPSDSSIWVSHFFSHFGSSYAEREAFHDALREAGFGTPSRFTEVGADEELEGDGYWHHWAFTVFEATEPALRAADQRARTVAEAHGVRYDQWMVQRDRADRPRLA